MAILPWKRSCTLAVHMLLLILITADTQNIVTKYTAIFSIQLYNTKDLASGPNKIPNDFITGSGWVRRFERDTCWLDVTKIPSPHIKIAVNFISQQNKNYLRSNCNTPACLIKIVCNHNKRSLPLHLNMVGV
jgi:hypothetical protein